MKHTIILLTALGLAVAGCKKDKEAEPAVPAPTTGTFQLSFGYHWDAADFDMANTYTDGAGNAIQFTTVKFFLSETHLESGGIVVADLHDSYILADAANEATHTLGTVPPGSFDQLEITIGLDSATNHADPTLAEAPLNDPAMHWAWNPAAGYKFLLLEGRVDDDGTGIVESDDPVFSYHCATDPALRTASLPFSGSVTAGGTLAQHVEVRVDLIVAGVNMLTTPGGMGYEPVNVQLMDNLAGAMEVE